MLAMVRTRTKSQNSHFRNMRAGLPDHVSWKCEEGRKLPDAGHGENENKEPEFPFPEHKAGLRGLAGPV